MVVMRLDIKTTLLMRHYTSEISWAVARGRARLLVEGASASSIARGMRITPQDADARSAPARSRSEKLLNEYRSETIAQKCEFGPGRARQEETL